MSHFEALAETVNRYCTQELDGEIDKVQYSNKRHQLYNKIKRSRLTVYQKDRLLQLLGDNFESAEQQVAVR